MPHLTSEALRSDPEGLAFLADVLRAPSASRAAGSPKTGPQHRRKQPAIPPFPVPQHPNARGPFVQSEEIPWTFQP